jgi:hypothetical protein
MFDFDVKIGWALFLGAFSILTMVGSVFLAFKVVMRIPSDYFKDEKTPSTALGGTSCSKRTLWNVLGCVLVVAGIAMLVLPGQGLLTIFAGLLIMDFPGKYRIERRLASIPGLLKVVNAIRRKAGGDPLLPPRQ